MNPKELAMNTKASKELILNTAVVIGAWLIVIAAGVDEHIDASASVVYINYHVE
jgi:hypothetical protein